MPNPLNPLPIGATVGEGKVKEVQRAQSNVRAVCGGSDGSGGSEWWFGVVVKVVM